MSPDIEALEGTSTELLQRVQRLEADLEVLRKQIVQNRITAVCCPDCGALPCAKGTDAGDLFVHCGVCGPDGGISLVMGANAPGPWENYWNAAVGDLLKARLDEKA